MKLSYLAARLQAEYSERGGHNHATTVVIGWRAAVIGSQPS